MLLWKEVLSACWNYNWQLSAAVGPRRLLDEKKNVMAGTLIGNKVERREKKRAGTLTTLSVTFFKSTNPPLDLRMLLHM